MSAHERKLQFERHLRDDPVYDSNDGLGPAINIYNPSHMGFVSEGHMYFAEKKFNECRELFIDEYLELLKLDQRACRSLKAMMLELIGRVYHLEQNRSLAKNCFERAIKMDYTLTKKYGYCVEWMLSTSTDCIDGNGSSDIPPERGASNHRVSVGQWNLSKIELFNAGRFDHFEHVEVDLNSTNTVVAGVNNAGKSTILTAAQVIATAMKFARSNDSFKCGERVADKDVPPQLHAFGQRLCRGRHSIYSRMHTSTITGYFCRGVEQEALVHFHAINSPGTANTITYLFRHTFPDFDVPIMETDIDVAMTSVQHSEALTFDTLLDGLECVHVQAISDALNKLFRAQLDQFGHGETERTVLLKTTLEYDHKFAAGMLCTVPAPGTKVDTSFSPFVYIFGSGLQHIVAILCKIIRLSSTGEDGVRPIMLLDEPDVHLDRPNQSVMLSILLEFATNFNIQLLMTTHSQEIVCRSINKQSSLVYVSCHGVFNGDKEQALRDLRCSNTLKLLKYIEGTRLLKVFLVENARDEQFLLALVRFVFAAHPKKVEQFRNSSFFVYNAQRMTPDQTVRLKAHLTNILFQHKLSAHKVEVMAIFDEDIHPKRKLIIEGLEFKKSNIDFYRHPVRAVENYFVGDVALLDNVNSEASAALQAAATVLHKDLYVAVQRRFVDNAQDLDGVTIDLDAWLDERQINLDVFGEISRDVRKSVIEALRQQKRKAGIQSAVESWFFERKIPSFIDENTVDFGNLFLFVDGHHKDVDKIFKKVLSLRTSDNMLNFMRIAWVDTMPVGTKVLAEKIMDFVLSGML